MNSDVRIGILVGVDISNNMRVVLTNLAKLIGGVYDLDLIVDRRVAVGGLGNYYEIYRGEGVDVADPAGIRSAWTICSRYLDRKRPDVLLNPCKPQTLGFVVALLGERHNIPSMVRMTGETFRQVSLRSGIIGKGKMWFLHEKMAGFAYSRADRILVVGKRLRKRLLDRGFDRSKIDVLPQPFDPVPFEIRRSKKKLKRELGLEPNKRVVLYVGRLSWYKGSDRLLEIIKEVSRRSKSYQFCLVGSGEYSQRFENFDDQTLKLAGNVHHQNLPDYYNASDLLVFPSRTEGLPNVMLEALAADLPVVASPVGEIPGFVSNTASSVKEYVEFILAERWARDSLPGYFSWDRQREAYTKLFSEVIQV